MTLQTSINIDINFNDTPDYSVLRYFGSTGIPVFFWDSSADYKNLEYILFGLEMKDHYESKFYNAVTVDKYVPWLNGTVDPKSSYEAYCLSTPEDLDTLSIPEYTISTPMQLRGKVCRLSLEALAEVDTHYSNTSIFTRKMIPVYPSVYTSEPIKVFTWFNDLDQIASFNPKSSEYELDAHLDLIPFDSEGEYYEY